MSEIQDLTARLDALTAEHERTKERLAAVEAENRLLRGPRDATTQLPPAKPDVAPSSMGRRRLLRDGLIAGAAATTAVVASGAPAAAATNDPILIGNGNTGSGLTLLQGSPFYAYDNVLPNTTGLTMVAGATDGAAANVGVVGWAEGTATTGVYARGPIGAEVRSNLTHLRLGPITASTRQAPVFDPIAHQAGDIVRTSAGEIWWCTTDGTPGQWVKLGGPTTAGSLHLLPAPVRVYDSRAGTTPSQGPKTPLPAGNVARTVDMTANNSGVPKSLTGSGGRFAATGVLLNVLLVNAAAGNGNLTVWANDQPKPQSNTLVWGGSDGRFSTLAVTGVDIEARIKIDSSLQTNVVIDVVGYYR